MMKYRCEACGYVTQEEVDLSHCPNCGALQSFSERRPLDDWTLDAFDLWQKYYPEGIATVSFVVGHDQNDPLKVHVLVGQMTPEQIAAMSKALHAQADGLLQRVSEVK